MIKPFFGQTALSSAPGMALATPSLATAAQSYMGAQKPNVEMLLKLAKIKAATKPTALKPSGFIALGNYGRGQPGVQKAIGQNFPGMQNFPYREAPKILPGTSIESSAGGDKYKTAAPAAEQRANEAVRLKQLAAILAESKFKEDNMRFDWKRPWDEYNWLGQGALREANKKFWDPKGESKPIVPPRGSAEAAKAAQPGGSGAGVTPLPPPKIPVVPKKSWTDDWN